MNVLNSQTVRFSVLSFVIVILFGCGSSTPDDKSDSPTPTPTPNQTETGKGSKQKAQPLKASSPTIELIQNKIIGPSCNSCHDTKASWNMQIQTSNIGLYLQGSHDNMVGHDTVETLFLYRLTKAKLNSSYFTHFVFENGK